jgi:hypothetical protein
LPSSSPPAPSSRRFLAFKMSSNDAAAPTPKMRRASSTVSPPEPAAGAASPSAAPLLPLPVPSLPVAPQATRRR